MPHAGNLYSGQDASGKLRILIVIVTGVLVADLDDLTTIVCAAMTAHEVRALGLMTLGALHRRDRVQLPVRRTTAARFTARRLPL